MRKTNITRLLAAALFLLNALSCALVIFGQNVYPEAKILDQEELQILTAKCDEIKEYIPADNVYLVKNFDRIYQVIKSGNEVFKSMQFISSHTNKRILIILLLQQILVTHLCYKVIKPGETLNKKERISNSEIRSK